MKGLAIFCLAALAFNSAKGGLIYNKWQEGAAIDPIPNLEPDLNGQELFNALYNNVGNYISLWDDNLLKQISDYAERYTSQGEGMSIEFLQIVTHINSSTPSNALDYIMIPTCLMLYDITEAYSMYSRRLAQVSPAVRKPFSSPAVAVPAKHTLRDLVKHLDLIIDSDLSRVADYTQELYNMAKQNVLANYDEILSSYQAVANRTLNAANGIVYEVGQYQSIVDKYTSSGILELYNVQKGRLSRINELWTSPPS